MTALSTNFNLQPVACCRAPWPAGQGGYGEPPSSSFDNAVEKIVNRCTQTAKRLHGGKSMLLSDALFDAASDTRLMVPAGQRAA